MHKLKASFVVATTFPRELAVLSFTAPRERVVLWYLFVHPLANTPRKSLEESLDTLQNFTLNCAISRRSKVMQ